MSTSSSHNSPETLGGCFNALLGWAVVLVILAVIVGILHDFGWF